MENASTDISVGDAGEEPIPIRAILWPLTRAAGGASNTNSKSKRYFCWRRCRLPQRMYNTPRRLQLAASISSLI